MDLKNFSKIKKTTAGFTLVELLIVIAVIGVLAAVILAVINPLEQLARGRDSGRISTISQLGSAAQRYFTRSANSYPDVPAEGNGTFMTQMQTSGEIQNIFTNPSYTGGINAGCTGTLNQNNYCYNVDGSGNAIIYVRAESNSNRSLCAGTTVAWIVWSSEAGRQGIVCTTNASTPPAITGLVFQN